MADLKVKISALPATTNVVDTDKFVIVQDGTTKQVDYTYVKSLLTGSDVLTGTFDNTSLTSNVLTLNHARNTVDIVLYIFNPDGYSEPVIWRKVDADNVSVDFGGTITGTWSYMLAYWNTGVAAAPTELTTKIQIGAWNLMDYPTGELYVGKQVLHGLDFSKINSVEVWIINDLLEKYINPLGFSSEIGNFYTGSVSYDDTTVNINLPTNSPLSQFEGYNSVLNSRGYIYIRYDS